MWWNKDILRLEPVRPLPLNPVFEYSLTLSVLISAVENIISGSRLSICAFYGYTMLIFPAWISLTIFQNQ